MATGASGGVDAPAGTQTSNPTRRPQLRRAVLYAAVAAVLLAGLAVVSFALGLDVGLRAASIAAAVALVPLLVVVPVFLWLDRLEAEPVRYLLFAFGWGALAATAGSLVLNTGIHRLLVGVGSRDADAWSAVLSAPPVEEALKGLGVLLVLLVRRREFDGIVDGIVYAGLTAAGFAFTENVLYLGRAFDEEGIVGLTAVFVVRGVVGPFAHPLFTAAIGIGLGLAAGIARSGAARVAFAVGGYAVAVLLHAIWNLSAVLGEYWRVYLLIQVPIFIAFLVLVVLLRRREAALIRRHLSQYADAGWLTLPEVSMLASVPARRAARQWARTHGGAAGLASMRAFQDSAADLALLRSRMVLGTAAQGAPALERELLEALSAHRAPFVGSRAS